MNKYISLLIVTLSEATIGVFVKLSTDFFSIYSINFYRVLFALIFMLMVVPFIDKKFWKLSKDNIKSVIIVGALIALQISMFNVAMSMAPIANVVIFWSVAPFFVFIFSSLFLKEPVKREHIFIFIVALIGIFIAEPLAEGSATGNIIALIDGAVYAALVTYMRYEGKTDSATLVVWYMFVATIILLPMLFIFGPGNLLATQVYQGFFKLQIPAIVWLICLGFISTGLAYIFIAEVLRKINVAVYSLIDIIVSPIVAAFFGYIIFFESPSSNMVYGGILLLISGFWLSSSMSKKKNKAFTFLINLFRKPHQEEMENPLLKNKQIK